ncbi:MAG TPA: hypothetical protein VF887_00200, partial [Gemmatimonadaceae bacterium]
ITVTPPTIQPGYEPVPGRGPQRVPTVFDTTTRRDTGAVRRPTVFDTTRRRARVLRDTTRRDTTSPRTDTIPSPARPPIPRPIPR